MEIRISPDFRIVANKLATLRTELLGRILDGSAPSVAEYVEQGVKQNVPVRTGEGRDSVHATVVRGGRGRSARIQVTAADYLRFVKLGTAPHIITPTHGRMLAWLNADGTLTFARSVNHPGQRANDFVARGWADAEPRVRRELREQGLRGWRELAKFK